MPVDPSDGGSFRAVWTWLRGHVWRLGLAAWRLICLRIPKQWLAGAGLICLVGAFLTPTVCGPRPAARRAACQSNLKQLGMGLAMYIQDHDGRLPDLPPGPTDLRFALFDYRTNSGTWLCPDHWTGHDVRHPKVSYGYNHVGLARNRKGLRVSEIANPESLLVLVDSDGPRAVPHALSRDYPGTPTAYRHEGRANVLWLDGHASSRRPAEIETRTGATGTARDFPHWIPKLARTGR